MMTQEATAVYGIPSLNERIASVTPLIPGNCQIISATQQGGACGGHSARRHHMSTGIGYHHQHHQHYHSTQHLYNHEIPEHFHTQKKHHSQSRSRSRRLGSNIVSGGSRYSLGNLVDDQNETCEQVDQSAFEETHLAEYLNNTSNNYNATTINYPDQSNFSTNAQNQVIDEELENLLRQNEETWIIYCSGKYNVEYQHQTGSKKIILKEKSESDSDSSICDYYIKKFKVPKINHNASKDTKIVDETNDKNYHISPNQFSECNYDSNTLENKYSARSSKKPNCCTSNRESCSNGSCRSKKRLSSSSRNRQRNRRIGRMKSNCCCYSTPKLNATTDDSSENPYEKTNDTQISGNPQDSSNGNANYIEVTITNTQFVGNSEDDLITGPGAELIKKLVNGSESYSPTSTYREFSQNVNFSQQSQPEQPITTQSGYQFGSNNNLRNNNYFDQNNYFNNRRQAQPSAATTNNYSYSQAPGYSSYDSHQHIYYQPQNFYQPQPSFDQQPYYQETQQQFSQPATFSAPMPPQQYANVYNQQLPPYQNINCGYGPSTTTGLYQSAPFMPDLDNYAASRHYHLLKKSTDDDESEVQVFEECRKSSNNVRGDKRRNSKRLSGSVRRALEAFNDNDDEDSYRCCTVSNCKSSRGHQMIASYHGSRMSSARPISSQYEQSADIEVCESTSGEELEELELEPKEKISQFSGIDNCIKVESRGVRESFLKSGCQSSSGNMMVGLLDAQEALSIGPGSLAGGSLFEGVLPSNFDTASQKIISAKQSQINHDEKSAFSEYNKVS